MPILKELDYQNFFYHHSYEENPPENMFVLHTHNIYEIFLLLKGDCSYEIESTYYKLSQYDIVIMRPYELHKLTANPKKPYERIVMQFNEELLTTYNIPKHLLNCFSNRKLGENNIIYAKNVITKNMLENYLFLESHLTTECSVMTLVKTLIQINEILNTTVSDNVKQEDDTPVQRTILYINEHITEDLTLDSIANHLFINKFYLNRLFKKAIGNNIYEYIIKKRLSLARHFITTGYTPGNACKACGYGNYSSFYRSYIKEFNKSPKEDMK